MPIPSTSGLSCARLSTSFPRPRGTRDLLPDDLVLVRHLERVARRVAEAAGCAELRPPLFEDTRLFARSLGDASDVVEKEMFTVPRRSEAEQAGPDEGGGYTFRPEGTAGAARAYLDAGCPQRAPLQKWYYLGPMFRYERPQKGRERQFTQFGAELFGAAGPLADAEVVEIALRFFEELGFGAELEVRVNSMGDAGDRERWRDALRAYFAPQLAARCADCRDRFARNVFRLLDCKVERCRELAAGAPDAFAVMGKDALAHHAGFLAALRALGRTVREDRGIVRGLDYYTRTVFEIHYPPLGTRSALCGGGRYDGLVAELGGPPTPAVGFAIGFTPTELALEALGLPDPSALADLRAALMPELWCVAVTEEERLPVLRFAQALRAQGLRVALDLRGKSAGAQIKEAGKSGAAWLAVLGPDERTQGALALRSLAGAAAPPPALQVAVDAALQRALAAPGPG
jgi:histidyl-tRNA synthetase